MGQRIDAGGGASAVGKDFPFARAGASRIDRPDNALRAEFFGDPQGQRTGVATSYADWALSWQHWFSPQIEIRPEVAYYRSFQADAFNGNANFGIAPNRNWQVVVAGDVIWHF